MGNQKFCAKVVSEAQQNMLFVAQNFRLNPRRTTYNSRSSVERVNKRVTVDYNIERCRVRSNKHWFFRGFVVATCLHLDVWSKSLNKKGTEIIDWMQN